MSRSASSLIFVIAFGLLRCSIPVVIPSRFSVFHVARQANYHKFRFRGEREVCLIRQQPRWQTKLSFNLVIPAHHLLFVCLSSSTTRCHSCSWEHGRQTKTRLLHRHSYDEAKIKCYQSTASAAIASCAAFDASALYRDHIQITVNIIYLTLIYRNGGKKSRFTAAKCDAPVGLLPVLRVIA